MLITAITQQKRDPSRYNIFIDGVYAFALPMQDILYFKLKEGQEAAEETIAFIRKNLIYIKAQDTALRFLGYKMRTVQEIRQKLLEKEFAEDVIAQVLAFLENTAMRMTGNTVADISEKSCGSSRKAAMRSDWSCGRGAFPPVSLRKCLRKRRLTRRAMPCGGWRKKAADNGRPKTKKRKNSCLISCCGRGIPTISSRRRFGRWRNGGESKWLFISEK